MDNLFLELPPEVLTKSQKGQREMFKYTKKSKKLKDKGRFAHLSLDYNDDKAMLAENDDRVNMLVDSLKAEHARKSQAKNKKQGISTKTKKNHPSVKYEPGTPASAPDVVNTHLDS
jgi:hypothetical protein